jgi:hypothetical protein
MNHSETGKYIIIGGAIILLIGLIYFYFGQYFGWLGKLPGDIRYETGSTKIFFPITTCILLTIILNLVIYLIKRLL